MRTEQLVYISRANAPIESPMDVADILEVSSRNNPTLQVTGVLAYCDDRFIQLLEGPSTSLDTLLERLAADDRHSDLEVLDRTPVTERAFADWAMLFPMFTPDTAARLRDALVSGRRSLAHYRDLLDHMAREQRRLLAA